MQHDLDFNLDSARDAFAECNTPYAAGKRVFMARHREIKRKYAASNPDNYSPADILTIAASSATMVVTMYLLQHHKYKVSAADLLLSVTGVWKSAAEKLDRKIRSELVRKVIRHFASVN